MNHLSTFTTPDPLLPKELAYRVELLHKAQGELAALQDELADREVAQLKNAPPSPVLVAILEHLGLIEPNSPNVLDIRQLQSYNALQLFNEAAIINGFTWSITEQQYINTLTGKRLSNARVLERITAVPNNELTTD